MPRQRSPANQDALSKSYSFFKNGRFDKAEELARRVLLAEPRNAQLLQFVAVLCVGQGKYDDAIALCTKAVRLDPNSGEAHYNLGVALFNGRRHKDAIASLRASLALLPGNYDALNILGMALLAVGSATEAEAAARRAIALASTRPGAHNTLGLALWSQRRLADAVESFTIALSRGHDPADAFNSLGRVYLQWNRSLAAIDCFQKALVHKPNVVGLLRNLAEAELRVGQYQHATRDFLAAAELAPHDADTIVGAAYAHLRAADWKGYASLAPQLTQALGSQSASLEPTRVLALADDPALHLRCSANFAAQFPSQGTAPFKPRPQSASGGSRDKIRLAYLSADFREHATAFLAAGLFEQHDRDRFEIHAFAWGSDESPTRRRLESAFDHFFDVSAVSDMGIADMIRDRNIDIAIDLKGYTGEHRCSILATRPAPIQVSYLGYPGTMGAEWIDYLVADRFVVPPEAMHFYREKLVYLPGCYQVNDDKRPAAGTTPRRSAVGLPEDAFVFACFNQHYKINPDMFDVWMRILKRAPHGVLWLLRQDDHEGGRMVESNLRRHAEARDIDSERLVFAPTVPLVEHIARLQCADLVLDTLPYNAHTTASDALWAGVPVLSCPGKSFQARVAGSLLHAVGLPDLVVASLADFESIALKLATSQQAHAEIRARLQRNRRASPLFDTARFTRNLEAAYEAMWQLWCEGRPPQPIDLEAVPLSS
jgi:predicted O-linked N-acetylglucosamine transferase (SPINDLY family)